MDFTPTQSLVDANIRRNQLQEKHKSLTDRINSSERFLEETEVKISNAEEVYGEALTQEVMQNSDKNRNATKKAKQEIEALKNQYSETRDILEAARLVRDKVTKDLQQATNKARVELKEYQRRNFTSYGWESGKEVLQALHGRVVEHYLANGLTSSPEAQLERLVKRYVDNDSEARKEAREIVERLSQAVTTDLITVGD